MADQKKTVQEAVSGAISMLEEVHRVLAAANDCGGRASALQEWAAKHSDRMTQVRTDMKAQDPAALKPEVQAQMAASADVATLFQVVRECITNTQFAEAWEGVAKLMD